MITVQLFMRHASLTLEAPNLRHWTARQENLRNLKISGILFSSQGNAQMSGDNSQNAGKNLLLGKNCVLTSLMGARPVLCVYVYVYQLGYSLNSGAMYHRQKKQHSPHVATHR